MRATFLICVILFAVFMFSVPAQAVSPKDVQPARSVGLGGSRTGASAADAIFLNPAALGASQQYTAQIDYMHSSNPAIDDGGDAIIVSIADSLSNPQFPTGIAYRYMSLGPAGDNAKGWITDFALGFPITENILIGTRVTYLKYDQGGREFSKFTGDLGALLKLDVVQLSVVGFNLLRVDSPEAARGLSTGLALTDSRLWRIGADVRWEWMGESAIRSWAGGAEYLLANLLPLRVGFELDGVRQAKFWSVGSGLVFQKFGIDVSYRRDLATGDNVWAFSGKLFGG